MKVIFLDIDGVLNCIYTKEEIYSFTFVSPQKIELLKQLVERTGAAVVLSSTWRHGWADMDAGINDSTDAKCYVALKKELENYGISLLDYTPVTNKAMNKRGEEIDAWLKSWQGETIESFQAGLSWECVLNKREAFRKAYDGFDVDKVCAYDEAKEEELRSNADIIRNKLKIKASIRNSRIFREIVKEYGSFYAYLKTFTQEEIIYENDRTTNELSDTISDDLKKRGMTFVGSTIIYFVRKGGYENELLYFRSPFWT